MENYNIKANGGVLRVNFGQDVSGAASYTMAIEPRYGSSQTIAPASVTLGAADVDVQDGKYLANQYVEYTIPADLFSSNNFSVDGQIWRKRATAVYSTGVVLAMPWTQFRVVE